MGDKFEGQDFYDGQYNGNSGGVMPDKPSGNTAGNTDWRAIGGGLLAGAGLLGSARSTGVYDPQERALKRFNELSNPDSDYYRKLRAMYSKFAANAAPTTDSLLGFSRAQGASSSASASLALAQGQRQTMAGIESVNNQLGQQFYQNEGLAQGYLNQHNQMLASQQDSQTSFFDNLLGLGGGLLSKVLV